MITRNRKSQFDFARIAMEVTAEKDKWAAAFAKAPLIAMKNLMTEYSISGRAAASVCDLVGLPRRARKAKPVITQPLEDRLAKLEAWCGQLAQQLNIPKP